MAELHSPFTLSSHSCLSLPAPSSHAQLPLATQPVLRLARSDRASFAPKPSEQVIVTAPGQGWSIHNVSNQSVLSSQKVSPTLVFGAPCVSISVPAIAHVQDSAPSGPSGTASDDKKHRYRLIYAPVASCSSLASQAVDEGRTIWLWAEKEVSGGFGEKHRLQHSADVDAGSTHLIKEFPARALAVQPLTAIEAPCAHPRPFPQVGRLLVLLQGGEVCLCDTMLSILAKTCFEPLCPLPSPAQAPLVRLQIADTTKPAGCPAPDLTTSDTDLRASKASSLIVYITRITPELHQEDQSTHDLSVSHNRGRKRKSTRPHDSTCLVPRVGCYTHLEVVVLQVGSDDALHVCGTVASSQNFYDVAVGAHGWVSVLGCDKILRTHQIRPLPLVATSIKPPQTALSFESHLQCHPLDISPCFPPPELSSSAASLPLLLPLHPEVPLVFCYISNPLSPRGHFGQVFDLRHRAVLYTLGSPLSTDIANTDCGRQLCARAPVSLSATLSASLFPQNLYFSSSYDDCRVVQALLLPTFSSSGPTWVETLNPCVTKATQAWTSVGVSDRTHPPCLKTSGNFCALPDLLKQSVSSLEPSSKGLPLRERLYQALKAFVVQFNELYGTCQLHQQWDSASATAADEAWRQVVKLPLNTPTGTRKGGKKSKKQHDQLSQTLPAKQSDAKEGSDGGPELTKLNHDDSVERISLPITLPRLFVKALLQMCLRPFTNPEHKSTSAEGAKPSEKIAPAYPAKIVASLLKLGVVEASMVPGGVLKALREVCDWENVDLAITRLIDVEESQLFQTLACLMRHKEVAFPLSSASSPEISKVPEADSTQDSVRRLFYRIVLQPLSQPGVRSAVRLHLDVQQVALLLLICKEWIDWWAEAILGASNPEDATVTSPGTSFVKGSTHVDASLMKANRLKECLGLSIKKRSSKADPPPTLVHIIQFVQNALDAHLVELIQYRPAHGLLASLKSCLSAHLEFGATLQTLHPPLTQFTMIKKQSIRQQSRSGSVKQIKKKGKKKSGPKCPATSLPKTKPQVNPGAISVTKARRAKVKDPKLRGTNHKVAMQQASLAVGEYAVERFAL